MIKKTGWVAGLLLLGVFSVFVMYYEGLTGTYVNYRKSLADVPIYMKDHFPTGADLYYNANLSMSYLPNTEPRNIATIFLTFNEIEDKSLEKEIEHLEARFIAKYEVTDPNLKIYGDTLIATELNIDNENIYYPIPMFDSSNNKGMYSKKEKLGLTDDFVIYLLDTKFGVYGVDLGKKVQLPIGWENGYSKGVFVSTKQKILIYWLLRW